MTRRTLLPAVAVLTSLAFAPGASAHPLATPDHAAAAASSLPPFSVATPDGERVRVRMSRKVGKTEASVATAEELVALLGSFQHSFELELLDLYVVRPSEMARLCGGEGILGCYGDNELIIPDEDTSDIPLGEVLAHEYGHHLAYHRRNSLGDAIEWGPAAWSSSESVCVRGDEGRLFTGYWDNPGEGFAEAYARLHYPNTTAAWDYSKLLKPDRANLEAIVFDAHNLLSTTASQTVFAGNLSRSHRTQTFSLSLPQDTRLRLRLAGPSGADYDLRLKTPGYYDEVTRRNDAQDRLNTTACFSPGGPKTVKIRVTRFRGSGPFRLTASYFDSYDGLG